VKTILWAMALATTQIAGVRASGTANNNPVLLTTEVAPAGITDEQATAKNAVATLRYVGHLAYYSNA
jgi:hypothetical protein